MYQLFAQISHLFTKFCVISSKLHSYLQNIIFDFENKLNGLSYLFILTCSVPALDLPSAWKAQKWKPTRPKPTCTSSAMHTPPASCTYLGKLKEVRLATTKQEIPVAISRMSRTEIKQTLSSSQEKLLYVKSASTLLKKRHLILGGLFKIISTSKLKISYFNIVSNY